MTEIAPAFAVAHDGWGELVLSRPERKNAVIGPMAVALREGLKELLQQKARVIVLRGEGGAFCSGLDIDAFNAKPAPDWLASFGEQWMAWHVDLYRCPAVIICALERYAINGGASMALGSDLLIAGEKSYVLVGEAAQGAPAPMNLAWLRLRASEAVIAQLTLTARRFHGPELHRLGLALDVVPDADVLTRARELAAQMAKFPGTGLLSTKYAMRRLGPACDGADWFNRSRERPPEAGEWSPQRQRVSRE
jgi:enoyl-CoA hydratase/carnithine racemase